MVREQTNKSHQEKQGRSLCQKRRKVCCAPLRSARTNPPHGAEDATPFPKPDCAYLKTPHACNHAAWIDRKQKDKMDAIQAHYCQPSWTGHQPVMPTGSLVAGTLKAGTLNPKPWTGHQPVMRTGWLAQEE
eukprot:283310-Chlamydomonas_euryale.AAC.5